MIRKTRSGKMTLGFLEKDKRDSAYFVPIGCDV
jgi:hypothetical protein